MATRLRSCSILLVASLVSCELSSSTYADEPQVGFGERSEWVERMQELGRRVAELKAAGEHEQAKRVHEEALALRKRIFSGGRELGALGQGSPEQAHKWEMVARRIEHLRIAAENLKQADAHELARQAMERAEAMKRELRSWQRQREEEAKAGSGMLNQLQSLRHENQELRAELEALRSELKAVSRRSDR